MKNMNTRPQGLLQWLVAIIDWISIRTYQLVSWFKQKLSAVPEYSPGTFTPNTAVRQQHAATQPAAASADTNPFIMLYQLIIELPYKTVTYSNDSGLDLNIKRVAGQLQGEHMALIRDSTDSSNSLLLDSTGQYYTMDALGKLSQLDDDWGPELTWQSLVCSNVDLLINRLEQLVPAHRHLV
jgi:hypothetical protein